MIKALVLSLFFASVSFAACPKEIRIGWEPYAPFQMKKGNDYVGIDFDIVKVVLDKMGCKYQFVERPWKRVLADLEKGDLEITGSASKNAEREKFAFFTNDYIITKNALFIDKAQQSKFTIKSLADMTKASGFKLGTNRGYEYGDEFTKASADPKFKAIIEENDNEEQTFKKIAAGRITATFSNEFVGMDTLKSIGLADKVVKTDFFLNEDPSYWMVSKKSLTPAFVDDFNKALESIKKDGTYQKILDKYLK